MINRRTSTSLSPNPSPINGRGERLAPLAFLRGKGRLFTPLARLRERGWGRGKSVIGIALLLALSPLATFAAEPVKLAFVCTGNTGRSVTMEALANEQIAAQKLSIVVISRGVDVDPFEVTAEANVQTLLGERDIDVSAHRSKQLSDNDMRHADVVLTATENHKQRIIGAFPYAKNKTFTLAEYATGTHQDVIDAWGKPMPDYQSMVKQVDSYIKPALQKALASKKSAD